MNLEKIKGKLTPEDLEAKLKEELNNGLPINWELFVKIEYHGGSNNNPVYKRIIDLFLNLEIFSLEQNGNIVLKSPDATSMGGCGNPRHYNLTTVECGGNPLFFVRDQDAVSYIQVGESLNYLVKGLQAQRINVIE